MSHKSLDRRYRLHGWAAIDHAAAHGGTLCAYREGRSPPARDSRPVSAEEARTLALQNPKDVYLDADLCESCLASGSHRPAITPCEDPSLPGCSALCAECAEAQGLTPPPA